MPRLKVTPPRPPLAPEMPPTTLAGYGLVGHAPRCRAVLLARARRVADESVCDCGRTGPNELRPVVVPQDAARWRE